jgi:hypothetical protein
MNLFMGIKKGIILMKSFKRFPINRVFYIPTIEIVV